MSSEEDINTDSSPESPANSKENAYFEPKPASKIIRLLTVFGYILSVSMAAILLSIYYICTGNGYGEQRNYDVTEEPVFPTNITSATFDMDNMTLESLDSTTEGIFPQREMQQLLAGTADEILSTSSTIDEDSTSPNYDFSLDNEIMYKYRDSEND